VFQSNPRAIRRRVVVAVGRFPGRLHRDEQGTISIISVFAVLLLTMLLGMVMNAGRRVDGKVRMQNAADAAAHSGGVVLARGMNTLAFTNHLLCDVFALTAFMREARDGNATAQSPEILESWSGVASVLETSGIPKFELLGGALHRTVAAEAELIDAYGAWAAASSELILPALEDILQNERIPEFQRALVQWLPDVAQRATMEVARRHSLTDPEDGGSYDRHRGEMLGVLWRSSGELVGGDNEWMDRSLPVVDPVTDPLPDQQRYIDESRLQRSTYAHRYLRAWNRQSLVFIDRYALLTRYGTMWRGFTCGQLNYLLDVEYPDRNLPHMIRTEGNEVVAVNEHLENHFTFVAVVYWQQMREMMPRLFFNPTDGDSMAYAAVTVFVPRRRLVQRWTHGGGGGEGSDGGGVAPCGDCETGCCGESEGVVPVGGMPGDYPPLTMRPPSPPQPPEEDDELDWYVERQRMQAEATWWNLINQSWTVKLVPATQQGLATILTTRPPLPEFDASGIELPNLQELTTEDIIRISPH